MSDVRRSKSYVWCPMFTVRCMMSDVWCPMSDLDVRCAVSNVRTKNKTKNRTKIKTRNRKKKWTKKGARDRQKFGRKIGQKIVQKIRETIGPKNGTRKPNITWPLGYTNFTFECWKYLSRVSEANEWEILSALEDKIRIPKRPYNILYMIYYKLSLRLTRKGKGGLRLPRRLL